MRTPSTAAQETQLASIDTNSCAPSRHSTAAHPARMPPAPHAKRNPTLLTPACMLDAPPACTSCSGEMEAEGMGAELEDIMVQLESKYGWRLQPGYNPSLRFMSHLWEPLRHMYRCEAVRVCLRAAAAVACWRAGRVPLSRWTCLQCSASMHLQLVRAAAES